MFHLCFIRGPFCSYLRSSAFICGSLAWFSGGVNGCVRPAERVADHNVLPADEARGGVEALRQRPAPRVAVEKDARRGDRLQERLVGVALRSRGPLGDQIGDERLAAGGRQKRPRAGGDGRFADRPRGESQRVIGGRVVMPIVASPGDISPQAGAVSRRRRPLGSTRPARAARGGCRRQVACRRCTRCSSVRRPSAACRRPAAKGRWGRVAACDRRSRTPGRRPAAPCRRPPAFPPAVRRPGARVVSAFASASVYPSSRATSQPPNFACENGSELFQNRFAQAAPVNPLSTRCTTTAPGVFS